MSFFGAKPLLSFAVIVSAIGQTFEVASIRPSGPLDPQAIVAGRMSIGVKVDAGRVWFDSLSLRQLIPLAYEIKPYQLNAPNWLSDQRFDIQATLPEGASKEQVPVMLRGLLETRFGLQAHKEEKEQNVYALIVDKVGPKMKVAPAASHGDEEDASKAGPSFGVNAMISLNGGRQGVAISSSGSRTGLKSTPGPNGVVHLEMEGMTMPDFVELITKLVDRPVVDRTGLAGAFQIAIDYSMREMGTGRVGAGAVEGQQASPAVASDPAGGSIFTSVRQLGLRLERTRAAVETVVVDSIEKQPTGN